MVSAAWCGGLLELVYLATVIGVLYRSIELTDVLKIDG